MRAGSPLAPPNDLSGVHTEAIGHLSGQHIARVARYVEQVDDDPWLTANANAPKANRATNIAVVHATVLLISPPQRDRLRGAPSALSVHSPQMQDRFGGGTHQVRLTSRYPAVIVALPWAGLGRNGAVGPLPERRQRVQM